MPSSPLSVTFDARTQYFLLSPQGWSFFTRSPREEVLRAYTLTESGLKRATFTHADARNWFGLRKAARGEFRELGVLVTSVRPQAWQPCNTSVAACVESTKQLDFVRLENTTWVQNYCGRIVVERRQPLPWAWAKFRHKTAMPGHIIALSIHCTDRRLS
jgi:antimicrobial peptide system SdpA family protein